MLSYCGRMVRRSHFALPFSSITPIIVIIDLLLPMAQILYYGNYSSSVSLHMTDLFFTLGDLRLCILLATKIRRGIWLQPFWPPNNDVDDTWKHVSQALVFGR